MIPILYYINDSQTHEELQAKIQLAKTLIAGDKYSGDKSVKKLEELLNCTDHWENLIILCMKKMQLQHLQTIRNRNINQKS